MEISNLQKVIEEVAEFDSLEEDIACGGLCPDDGDGQFYNGVRIDEDTILVLESYWGKYSNSTEYYHYSISKNEIELVDAVLDEKYRELFEDCDMLDLYDCFFICGMEPTKNGKAERTYGAEYVNTIVDLWKEVKSK